MQKNSDIVIVMICSRSSVLFLTATRERQLDKYVDKTPVKYISYICKILHFCLFVTLKIINVKEQVNALECSSFNRRVAM